MALVYGAFQGPGSQQPVQVIHEKYSIWHADAVHCMQTNQATHAPVSKTPKKRACWSRTCKRDSARSAASARTLKPKLDP